MTYEWRIFDRFPGDTWAGLLPADEPNNFSMDRIASIYRRGDGMYVGSYYYPHDGGKHGSWVVQKTRRGCQRWIERKLQRFWEPPIIQNAITA